MQEDFFGLSKTEEKSDVELILLDYKSLKMIFFKKRTTK